MEADAGLTDRSLYPRFSDAEFTRRHSMIGEAMDKGGLDALVIYGGPGAPEVPYLINYLPQSPCWLMYPRQGEATCFLHFHNHIPCAKAQATIEDIRAYGLSPIETVANHLSERGLSHARIGLVSLNTISYNILGVRVAPRRHTRPG